MTSRSSSGVNGRLELSSDSYESGSGHVETEVTIALIPGGKDTVALSEESSRKTFIRFSEKKSAGYYAIETEKLIAFIKENGRKLASKPS